MNNANNYGFQGEMYSVKYLNIVIDLHRVYEFIKIKLLSFRFVVR